MVGDDNLHVLDHLEYLAQTILNPCHNSFHDGSSMGILLQLFGVLIIVGEIYEKEGDVSSVWCLVQDIIKVI